MGKADCICVVLCTVLCIPFCVVCLCMYVYMYLCMYVCMLVSQGSTENQCFFTEWNPCLNITITITRLITR